MATAMMCLFILNVVLVIHNFMVAKDLVKAEDSIDEIVDVVNTQSDVIEKLSKGFTNFSKEVEYTFNDYVETFNDFVNYSMDEFEVVELLADTHTEGIDNTEDIKKCIDKIYESYRRLEEEYNKSKVKEDIKKSMDTIYETCRSLEEKYNKSEVEGDNK